VLRLRFPALRAWQPGYAPLLGRLLRGHGHTPKPAKKDRQTGPGMTGCTYADDVLLPALRKYGRFSDQEVLDMSFEKSATH